MPLTTKANPALLASSRYYVADADENRIIARVRHWPDYLSKGWSHIEIMVLKPQRAPLPISETGDRSHFLGHGELERAGGRVRFFLDWIEREAASKQWSRAEFMWRQGDVFA